MTKSEAGRLGGLSTYRRYGGDHMRMIGRLGASAFWERYTLQPTGVSGWLIVSRQDGSIKAAIGNLPAGLQSRLTANGKDCNRDAEIPS